MNVKRGKIHTSVGKQQNEKQTYLLTEEVILGICQTNEKIYVN